MLSALSALLFTAAVFQTAVRVEEGPIIRQLKQTAKFNAYYHF
jgi:hypothetical protein